MHLLSELWEKEVKEKIGAHITDDACLQRIQLALRWHSLAKCRSWYPVTSPHGHFAPTKSTACYIFFRNCKPTSVSESGFINNPDLKFINNSSSLKKGNYGSDGVLISDGYGWISMDFYDFISPLSYGKIFISYWKYHYSYSIFIFSSRQVVQIR